LTQGLKHGRQVVCHWATQGWLLAVKLKLFLQTS
jgi:hypothetical protein